MAEKQNHRRKDRLTAQIDFLVEIDRLKEILRRSYHLAGPSVENTAEHSWHVVMAAMVLAEYADEPINLEHVIRMLALHDIVEIDAGDTYIYDEGEHETKDTREQLAAERIFGLLPPEQGRELRSVWEEFETRQTPEARFAGIVDRLMPLIHNVKTNGRSWQENGVVASQVRTLFSRLPAGSRRLTQLSNDLIEEAVAAGYLPE